MTEVYLALGANVGDREANLKQAIKLLKKHLENVQTAPFYNTKAVGYTDQPDFLNTAISGQTEFEPLALLKFVKDIEQEVGRTETFRWGPREIDIDIIFYGDQILETKDFTIPHPRFRERAFVLRPLADLNPDLHDPGSGKTVAQLLDQLN